MFVPSDTDEGKQGWQYEFRVTIDSWTLIWTLIKALPEHAVHDMDALPSLCGPDNESVE
jgi:hypothetical protein